MLDGAKPPPIFQRKAGEDVESWILGTRILGIKLYYAANLILLEREKAIRIALNLKKAA